MAVYTVSSKCHGMTSSESVSRRQRATQSLQKISSPFKVNVELRHQHIRTLLLLFFVQTIDLKDTVNKICVNLCVVDQNRESILRQIIETVIMNTMDRC